MNYEYREGYSLPVKAQIVGERIAEIRARIGGRTVGNHDVLEDARPEGSPLHPIFPWDDHEAAEKYRLELAGKVLRSFTYEAIRGEQTVREIAYVSVSTGPKMGSAYMHTPEAMSDRETSDIVIADARAVLAGFTRRFRHLSTIAKALGLVEQAIAALDEELPKDGKAKDRDCKRTRKPAARRQHAASPV